ncbi:MAG: sugar ABC transporter substrate-binding protein [Gemmatimonadales bacterium]|nr:sugar ABC transporter substrate-binding protein [Gemmatimonadales bacterium]MBP6570327.1 sugar ABC transporter substrate-binding protein [Gemmatimonadales bacterium]MBP7620052.1 sugar ABC transporter substrate-binding protein [Gemmatimonadales bacterium]
MNRRWARVGIGCLTALVACGAPDPTPTLRFWAFGREGEVVQELVRGFEREHPGVRVRVQQIPWSAAHEKLLTAIVGRATPDVAQLGNTWIPEMVTLDALAPVATAVADSSYFPGILATNMVRDTLFGLPWYVDTRVVFYRKDLLRAAGYATLPEDWAGWRAAMVAIKRRAGPGQYAIFLPMNEWPPLAILGLQQGSALIDSAGFGTFRGPAFTRAFDFLLSLYRDSLAPPVSNTQISNLYQEFSRGTFAMYISGPWNLGEFRRRLPAGQQDDWGTAPIPGPTGAASGVSLAGGSSLVVFRASKHRALALALVEYLSRPEMQARFYRLTGDLPARREAWSDSVLAADREAQVFRVQLDRTVPTPMVPEWEEVTTKLMDHAEAAVRGGRTPVEALTALDRDTDRLLERRRFLLARRAWGTP